MQVTKKRSKMSVRKRTAYQAGKAVKKFAVLEGDTLRLYVNFNCNCVILSTSIDAPSSMYINVNLLYKVARRSYELKHSTFCCNSSYSSDAELHVPTHLTTVIV